MLQALRGLGYGQDAYAAVSSLPGISRLYLMRRALMTSACFGHARRGGAPEQVDFRVGQPVAAIDDGRKFPLQLLNAGGSVAFGVGVVPVGFGQLGDGLGRQSWSALGPALADLGDEFISGQTDVSLQPLARGVEGELDTQPIEQLAAFLLRFTGQLDQLRDPGFGLGPGLRGRLGYWQRCHE